MVMGIEVKTSNIFGVTQTEEQYKPKVYEKVPRRDPPPHPPHCPPPSPHTSMFPLFKFLKEQMKSDGRTSVK